VGDGKLIIIISMTVSGLMNDIMTFIVRWIAWRLQLVACATKPLRPVVTGQWSVVSGQGHRAVDCVVMPTLMTAYWLRDSLHLPANKLSPRGDAETICPLPPDGSSTSARIAADLRPSADGSAVRTSAVAKLQAASVPIA